MGWSSIHMYHFFFLTPREMVPSEATVNSKESQAPPLRVPVLGREVPVTSGGKNQQGLWLRDTEVS